MNYTIHHHVVRLYLEARDKSTHAKLELELGRTQATGHATGQATPSSRASRARHVGFDPTVSEARINKPATSPVGSDTREEGRTEREERSPWSSSSPPGVRPAREAQARRREKGESEIPVRKKGNDKSYANISPHVGPLRIAVVGLSRRRRCGDKARVKRPTRAQTYLCT